MLKRLSAFSILVFVTLCAPLQGIAQTQQPNTPPPDYYWPGPGHMMWSGGYWGGGWPFWGMFPMMFMFLILVCVVVFFLVRMASGGGRHHGGPTSHDWADPTYSALQILNERFARGEVQKQEYEEKRGAILSGTRGRA